MEYPRVETSVSGQTEWVFYPHDFPPPSVELRNWVLDRNRPGSPYYGYRGNVLAVEKLITIDCDALAHYNHLTSSIHVAFLGTKGCGKTELVRRHNRARGLPLVKLSPRGVRSVQDVFMEISRVANRFGVPLIAVGEAKHYVPPPLDVFIDEVHACSPSLIQGLLQATEIDDHFMVTEKGIVVNTVNLHWMVATTDRGKLFDAFDDRFVKVYLQPYTREDIAQIVQSRYPKLDYTVCELVAHYASKVPRDALAFTRLMRLVKKRFPGISWEEAARRAAQFEGIDEYGMLEKRLVVLKALGQSPVAERRLGIIAGVKQDEVDRYLMPWLLEGTEDQEPLVRVTRRGYMLTEAGIQELAKRGIPYDLEAVNERV